MRLLGVEGIRRAFLDQAALHAAHRVLDIGCGTGTLAVLIKRLHPKIEVVGLDPDPHALARARRKAARAAVSIRFDQGFSDNLPYPEGRLRSFLTSDTFARMLDSLKIGSDAFIVKVEAYGSSDGQR